MRLVAVSVVKNEADIVEAFVRHTHAWVDHHLVFDHDSTDGTREILAALQREGLPLTLYTDSALGNLQQARSNFLTRLAAESFDADWILPLDADEILSGPGRPRLEGLLASSGSERPVSLRLLNYYPVTTDGTTETNPVLRLRHCQHSPSQTKKIMISSSLARESSITAGKGNHVLLRGDTVLADVALPVEFHLCHLALRSVQHQVLRVVLAELQKLSRGRAHAGLDVHYPLGFQLLSEDSAAFFATTCPPAASLRLLPIAYLGTPLRYSKTTQDWDRVARALLPYLEKLAMSHGALLDSSKSAADASPSPATSIYEIAAHDLSWPPSQSTAETFAGFEAQAGGGPPECPVPGAFLPPSHWGNAPATLLTVDSPSDRPAILGAEALTYCENRSVSVEPNGERLHTQFLARINQRERLRQERNELSLHNRPNLVTDHNPRQLAAVFLGLRIITPEHPES